MGPGVITGAANDDPSGIATYTQTGAQFGYGQLWTVVLMLPLMIAVQEACARIGAVTGRGLAAVIKKNYNRKILFAVVGLVVLANIINIGADLGAIAAAIRLLMPINFSLAVILFAALILFLEVFLSYRVYARVLKWFCLALVAYPLTVFLVRQPWGTLWPATFLPKLDFGFEWLFIITGVFGTTISPYMFFWQASEEVEEEKSHHLIKAGRPHLTKDYIKNLRVDNWVGMLFSEIATWSIIVTAATVLHQNGLVNINSAADAAAALEPLVATFPNAGFLAKVIFATGIVGLGLLAIPVLSASAAYALSEALNWREGLNLRFRQARGFYGVIVAATVVGLAINFLGINQIKALVFTAVFNGVAAVPLLFFIARLAASRRVMGRYRSGAWSRVLVWLTFAVMALAALAMFITLGKVG